MSRNVESRFAVNPTRIDLSRSRFNRSASYKTTFNVGSIIPFYVDEVLPGDTFNVKTSKVVRMQTLITPMMDNLYLDTYYFFVPNRLVWEHWQEFMGENTQSAWIPQAQYSVPQIEPPQGGWNIGTLADYFGIPTGVDGISVNALPFRAYALICNDWFRDENLSDPLNIPVNDSTVVGVNTGTFVTDVAKGGLPYTAAKYHDYFTSCLPGPQKGANVSINIPLEGEFPVFGSGYSLGLKGFTSSGGGSVKDSLGLGYVGSNASIATSGAFGYDFSAASSQPSAGSSLGSGSGNVAPIGVMEKSDFADADDYVKTGLQGEFQNSAISFSVNALRTAFQIQKLLEKDARGGTRYIELLKSHFGVTSPDARLQRPEYLGGNRIPIKVNQVVQNSETQTTPQGTTAAYSHTVDSHSDFIKSFVEHGFVIGVMVARYDHTYQQGLQRFWSRSDRYSYYWPVLANIGEQPVLNQEIYCDGSSTDGEVFGYQEAWADYRYKPSVVTGEMRSAAATSLDVWHLADDYNSLPYLSDSWIREDYTNVDRVLAVTSAVSNQLFADIYVQNRSTRPMPLYSIPGLIDHH